MTAQRYCSPIVRWGACLALTLMVSGTAAWAQGTRADYERADQLRQRTRGKVIGGEVEAHWLEDGATFWYRAERKNNTWKFLVVDALAATREPAFDHPALAGALASQTEESVDPERLPIDRLVIEPDGPIRFRAFDRGWRYDPATETLEETDLPESDDNGDGASDRNRRRPPSRDRGRGAEERREITSPDGQWAAFVRDHNLWIRNTDDGSTFPLSYDGSGVNAYRPDMEWSPDSKRLVAMKRAQGDERAVYLIEAAPDDQLQPELHELDYLKPGDQVSYSVPHLFDIEQRREIPIDDALFSNPWRIDHVRWAPDSSRFTFRYNQRGHQVLRILSVDAHTGAVFPVIKERSDTFIDYSQKGFVRYFDETDEILWASERDGWNHLYLFDSKTGALKHQVTSGDWLVRHVDHIDEEARQVWFRGGGLYSDQDPYYIHSARVNFDGTGLVRLTEGNGTHRVRYSPDRRFLVDTYSRVDMPPVTELRSAEDGSLIMELECADWSALLETDWQVPEPFVAKGRDGETDIYGVIFRPSDYDPEGCYPVIEKIYAGPQGAFVPKSFREFYREQALAELGFIVVQIDGMGTNWRSKTFHDVCWRNLGDAGFPDRIAWLNAAAERDPAMDLERIGIYGGSAGGQNALGGLLFHPEFYKVGVADCGCHDNRMDKIWWNEAWMGWPVGPHYAASSNVEHAHKLQGRLLLTVGAMDRNVDPSSTMQVVEALIDAQKDFELIVFPSGGHGAGGSRYGVRRRRDFFVKHLLGVDPPDWNAAPAGDEASAQ